MKITCHYHRCSSNGFCEAVAPDYFEIQHNGDLAVLRAEVDPDDLDYIERAVDSCPTQALTLTR